MFTLTNITFKGILNIESLIIPERKVTCIVGESGSGKTTLMRLLNKLISPDGGEIMYHGSPLQEINSVELRRKVVMLPQTPAIFPGTIRDNLLLGLKFAEQPAVDDDGLHVALQAVHLAKQLENNADKLSGGEKQRLALARLLLLNADVFLLDEPSSALDDDTEQLVIEQLVRHTQAHIKTLIMVTHSKQVARKFAHYIVEIKNGRIVREEIINNVTASD